MTTPYERTRALVLTKDILHRLSSLGDDVVPLEICVEAEALLRHYPALGQIELAHLTLPQIFGPVPPYSPRGRTADVPEKAPLSIVDSLSIEEHDKDEWLQRPGEHSFSDAMGGTTRYTDESTKEKQKMPLRYSKHRLKTLKSVATLQQRGTLEVALYREFLRLYKKALRQLRCKE